jgi:hypothetical protein
MESNQMLSLEQSQLTAFHPSPAKWVTAPFRAVSFFLKKLVLIKF